MSDITQTLQELGKRYGDFLGHSVITQNIKRAMKSSTGKGYIMSAPNTNFSAQIFDKGVASCRGCRQALRGNEYCYGGSAYHPRTGEQCKVNHYGGYVCSRDCDFRASLELEQSMPGHDGRQRALSCYANESIERNWRNS